MIAGTTLQGITDQIITVVMTWTVRNAWPAKVAVVDHNAEDGEVIVDSNEFGHEGMTVEPVK